MLADFLLRVLGRDPAAYPDVKDKWPVVLANFTNLIIPYVLVVLFVLPLLITWWLASRKSRRFRDINIYVIVAALIIGGLLSWGGYWIDQWSYGYGQGVIFNEIYGS